MPTPTRSLPVTLNHGHPLARSVIAAWVVDASGSCRELVYGQEPIVAVSGTPTRRATAAGAAYSGQVRVTPVSERLKRPESVSLFWYGVVLANTGANNPAIVAHYHNNSNSAPFVSYGLMRPNSTDLWIAFNNAGTFGNLVATNVVSTAQYERPLALGATFGTAAVRGYRQGREVVAGAGIAGITYHATTSLVAFNHGFNEAFTATALTYIFGAELTPTDHALLAEQPYGLVTRGRPLVTVSDVVAAAAVARVQPFVWMPV